MTTWRVMDLPLFPDAFTIGPRPPFLCPYERACRPAPLATFSPPERIGDAENVEICCLKCGRRGIESTRVCTHRADSVATTSDFVPVQDSTKITKNKEHKPASRHAVPPDNNPRADPVEKC